MNATRLTIILMLCSLALATQLHRNQAQFKRTGIDRFYKAMEGMRAYISPTSSLLINNTSKVEFIQAYSRYVLAPTFTNTSGDMDTILTIINIEDTIPDSIERKIIWQHSDDGLRYILSSKK